ncbi:hypothetical protein Sa4125_09200 [Aureimonas sp. SA4125]|uniref:glycosyltransferase family 2 protein n=1 Tax=Aureimonas sp. SA4125 TaxID=2826993 RepID=UPI001CC42376|nr:glycosyltransferase family 2 protein [Aureimonas sp. SA4125]BDA83378.1 hypothetical protein Sa4125_09200 [Aureimonas sp. SA4125]
MMDNPRFEETGTLVSIVMAAHNVEDLIDEAIASARAQTHGNLEVLIIDDGSTDGTVERVSQHAQVDPRVRCISGKFGGPAAARNRAIAEARGDWLLVCDADDVMHPRRIERMLLWARDTGAAIVGDELIAFSDTGGKRTAWLFIGRQSEGPVIPVTAEELFGLNTAGKASSFGYMKPLIDVRALRRSGAHYREHLMIGEDFDFLAQFILGGEKVVYVPEPYYLYRRRSTSVSHRIDASQVRQMLAANDAILSALPAGSPTSEIVRERGRRLGNYARSVDLIASLKAGDLRAVAAGILKHPGSMAPLARSLTEAVRRRVQRNPADEKVDCDYSLSIRDSADGKTSSVKQGSTVNLAVGTSLAERATAAALAVALGRTATAIDCVDPGLEDYAVFAKGCEQSGIRKWSDQTSDAPQTRTTTVVRHGERPLPR